MNIFRKQKQDGIEEKPPQPANDETVSTDAEQLSDEEIAAEIVAEYGAPPPSKFSSMTPALDKHSRRNRTQKSPREYQGYETDTSPKWINMYFANGRRVLISHFDIKRVDSMNPEAISIFCSDCVVRLEGRNLHKLIDDLEKIRRITAFDDEKFDTPSDDEVVIEVIKLTELHSVEV